MMITSETPALAKVQRATRYTLARQVSATGTVKGTHRVLDMMFAQTMPGSTRYAGLTLSNALR
jgi:hypothetical protein